MLSHRSRRPIRTTRSRYCSNSRSGVSGMLAAVRSTPLFWRVHVFGRDGSAEALGRTELVLRRSGEKPQRLAFPEIELGAGESGGLRRRGRRQPRPTRSGPARWSMSSPRSRRSRSPPRRTGACARSEPAGGGLHRTRQACSAVTRAMVASNRRPLTGFSRKSAAPAARARLPAPDRRDRSSG